MIARNMKKRYHLFTVKNIDLIQNLNNINNYWEMINDSIIWKQSLNDIILDILIENILQHVFRLQDKSKDASVMLLLKYELSAKTLMTFCKTYTTCWVVYCLLKNLYYLLKSATMIVKKCILLIKRLLRNTLRCYLLS